MMLHRVSLFSPQLCFVGAILVLIEAGSRFDATTNIFSEINLNAINRLFVCLLSALASVLTVCFALKAIQSLETLRRQNIKKDIRNFIIYFIYLLRNQFLHSRRSFILSQLLKFLFLKFGCGFDSENSFSRELLVTRVNHDVGSAHASFYLDHSQSSSLFSMHF